MSELPDPLVSPDVDLRDFPFTPMFRSRLFGSDFHAKVSDAGWRAGVTLWLRSWDQVPAGTLPDDDVALCRLAELGRDIKAWRKVAKEALWGWFKCSDGRLHHKTVAEGVIEAWQRKHAQRDRTEAARAARAAKRQQHNEGETTTEDVARSVTGSVTEIVTGSKGQGQGHRNIAASQLGGGAREKRLEPHHDGPDEFAKAQAACVKAIGDGHPVDPVFGPIMILIDRGIPLREITTVMRSEADARRAKGRTPIKFWSKWAEIVVERLDAAPKIAPERSGAGEPRIDFGGGYSAAESTIISVLGRGEWITHWGAKPGEAGCKVPERLWPKAAAA